ncbi:MAG: HipA domain-containing protein [Bacteroidales bacterium]|nr:HipA domain-containing protein [Bacteroidales bacterium]
MSKCLYCYKELANGETDFHPSCAKRIFGTKEAPLLPYTRADINELARQIIRSQTTVPGVQAKLSLDLTKDLQTGNQRFTIVGLWGRFILKPQTEQYECLPELEDATMHLAEIANIQTVPHSLIRFQNGELAYITRRIDRTHKGGKIPMEDMCQLTQRLTEHKYRGSYEQIAKAIVTYSSAPNLDLVIFFEQVVFSWIVGNADMHLKNYSLYKQTEGYRLTPAYDLLNTKVVMPQDADELALTLNGKKRKLTKTDFVTAMSAFNLNAKTIANIFQKFINCHPQWNEFLANSFLPEQLKEAFKRHIEDKLKLVE